MSQRKEASQTAIIIASLRALSCFENDPLIKGNDHLAQIFLPAEKRRQLNTREIRSTIKKAIPEGLYAYMIARTKYFDGLFAQYLRQQIPQIVLLGAGFDTKPYRFANQIDSTVIYEVDKSETQALKQQILKDNNIKVHPNIRYVPADFEQLDWFGSLQKAGYQSTLPTLYLWEGVTFYLSPASVETMLETLKSHSASGSLLSFDFQHHDEDNALIDTGLDRESIKFGLDTNQRDRFLNRFGYTIIEHVNAEAMGTRFLTMTDGSRFDSVKPIMNIITAQL